MVFGDRDSIPGTSVGRRILGAGLFCAAAIAAIMGYGHITAKDSAVEEGKEEVAVEFNTKVDSLGNRLNDMGVTLKVKDTTIDSLYDENETAVNERDEAKAKAKQTEAQLNQERVNHQLVQEGIKTEYENQSRASLETQLLNFDPSYRNFRYNCEDGEDGMFYLTIKPIEEGTPLQERVEVVIPRNIEEIEGEFSVKLPGFVDQHGLKFLTKYAELEVSPNTLTEGLFNITTIDKDGNEGSIEFYTGTKE